MAKYFCKDSLAKSSPGLGKYTMIGDSLIQVISNVPSVGKI